MWRRAEAAYADRAEAGDRLAAQLQSYAELAARSEVVVLGLVRGGVPVAARVAAALAAPLDVLVVRKLGVPWAPEVAFGAVGPGGIAVHNPDVEAYLSRDDIESVIRAEADELARRERRYRGGRAPLDLAGKVAIIVDDGLATGATARAAVAVARRLLARTVVVAIPVGAADSLATLRAEADEVICPLAPAGFGAVSRYYRHFPQTSDEEVIALVTGAGR
jgi:predicted phosphoribosyltransferase